MSCNSDHKREKNTVTYYHAWTFNYNLCFNELQSRLRTFLQRHSFNSFSFLKLSNHPPPPRGESCFYQGYSEPPLVQSLIVTVLHLNLGLPGNNWLSLKITQPNKLSKFCLKKELTKFWEAWRSQHVLLTKLPPLGFHLKSADKTSRASWEAAGCLLDCGWRGRC